MRLHRDLALLAAAIAVFVSAHCVVAAMDAAQEPQTAPEGYTDTREPEKAVTDE